MATLDELTQMLATSGLSEPQQKLIVSITVNFKPFLDNINAAVRSLSTLISTINAFQEEETLMISVWENEGGALW